MYIPSSSSGLEEMSNLEELDVQCNLLSFLGVLGVLGALPHLRVLTLLDNPLVFHPSYRTRVITMLNPATANKEVSVYSDIKTMSEPACVHCVVHHFFNLDFHHPPLRGE